MAAKREVGMYKKEEQRQPGDTPAANDNNRSVNKQGNGTGTEHKKGGNMNIVNTFIHNMKKNMTTENAKDFAQIMTLTDAKALWDSYKNFKMIETEDNNKKMEQILMKQLMKEAVEAFINRYNGTEMSTVAMTPEEIDTALTNIERTEEEIEKKIKMIMSKINTDDMMKVTKNSIYEFVTEVVKMKNPTTADILKLAMNMKVSTMTSDTFGIKFEKAFAEAVAAVDKIAGKEAVKIEIENTEESKMVSILDGVFKVDILKIFTDVIHMMQVKMVRKYSDRKYNIDQMLTEKTEAIKMMNILEMIIEEFATDGKIDDKTDDKKITFKNNVIFFENIVMDTIINSPRRNEYAEEIIRYINKTDIKDNEILVITYAEINSITREAEVTFRTLKKETV